MVLLGSFDIRDCVWWLYEIMESVQSSQINAVPPIEEVVSEDKRSNLLISSYSESDRQTTVSSLNQLGKDSNICEKDRLNSLPEHEKELRIDTNGAELGCKEYVDAGGHKPAGVKNGRKRRRVDSSKRGENDDAESKKVKEEVFKGNEIIGRVLRSRTKVTVDVQKEIHDNHGVAFMVGKNSRESGCGVKRTVKMRKSKSSRPVGRPRKQDREANAIINRNEKVTSSKQGAKRRGRPPRLSHQAERKSTGKHLRLQKISSTKRNIAASSGRSSKMGVTSNKKKKNAKKQNKSLRSESFPSRSEVKQLLRERIMKILVSAGWKIDYRPRNGREYFDAVYLSPEGRSYWSVTLAYHVFKTKLQDVATNSSFTPIPEEELKILTRVVTKKRSDNKEKLKKGDGGSKTDEGGDKKSTMSSKTKRKVLIQKDSSSNKKPKKRMRLLVRTSTNGADSVDGLIPYKWKRDVLNWMIDLGIVPLNCKVQYMNRRKTRTILEGRIKRGGVLCGCCSETLAVSKFENHSKSKLCKPFENIYLDNGNSLIQSMLDSWNKQEESERSSFHYVNVDGDDPNDDTCGICGDGGDLICCDGCPSTFHQSCLDIEKCPSGDWRCIYCSCKFCGVAGVSAYQKGDTYEAADSALLTCCLCEQKYHHSCILEKDLIHVASNSTSFCGKKCQELFQSLQMLLGVKHEMEEGYSWSVIHRFDIGQDMSLSGLPRKVECNAKLAVALSVMDECFLPIIDERSGINLIHNVMYNCGSNFQRVNYSGFFTFILERNDEIISAASVRIHGNRLAEMPFIGTRHIYRRQGMCRRLLNAIESALGSLNVEKLVIPAISELMETWTSVFGFKPLEESYKREIRCMNLLVFHGTDMLQKPLRKHKLSADNMNPASGWQSTQFESQHPIMQEGAKDSDISVSDETTADHSHDMNDEATATPESGSQNDASDITSEKIICEVERKSIPVSQTGCDKSKCDGDNLLHLSREGITDSCLAKGEMENTVAVGDNKEDCSSAQMMTHEHMKSDMLVDRPGFPNCNSELLNKCTSLEVGL